MAQPVHWATFKKRIAYLWQKYSPMFPNGIRLVVRKHDKYMFRNDVTRWIGSNNVEWWVWIDDMAILIPERLGTYGVMIWRAVVVNPFVYHRFNTRSYVDVRRLGWWHNQPIGPLLKNVLPTYDKNIRLCFQMALTCSHTNWISTYVFYNNVGTICYIQ